jgi:hypothetical protein
MAKRRKFEIVSEGAETEIANILDKARWKLINIRDEFTEERYTKIYDEYQDKLIDLILELDPNYFYPQYNPYSKN